MVRTHCAQGHVLTVANTYRVQGRRRCRVCCAAKIKAWRLAHRDDPQYKARRNESALRSYRRHRAVKTARVRQAQTGMSPAEYDQRFVAQDGLCAVCRTAAARVADHNHATKTVRGLLCARCNLFLGYIEKTPQLVGALLTYLQRWDS